MKLKTDLNERERLRFCRILRDLAKAANEAADALELEDDDKLMMAFAMMSIEIMQTSELNKIMMQAVERMPDPVPPPSALGR